MKTSIIILTFNQLHHNILCIDSIRKYTEKGTYEIIVVDNHSTDGTTEWLKSQTDLQTVFNSENAGFPKGCNQGMALAQGDDLLLLNNDVIVTPNWLSNLRACLYSSDDIGAVGAVTNNCSNFQSIPVNYKNTEEMLAFAEKNNVSNGNQWEEKLRLVAFCMLVKKEVVDKIGLLDERFSPGNFEDDDYSFRIRKAGYRLLLCKDAFIHHYGSASFNSSQSGFGRILNINRKKFLNKWGFDAWSAADLKDDLVKLMTEPASKAVNVLEIGCSTGAALLHIKNKYKKARLFGIDTNKKALEIVKGFADAQCLDIEKEPLPYDENFFDFILMSNVLDHLYDPLAFLKSIKKYLKRDGEILAGIPNVMFCGTIRNLINGNWGGINALPALPLHFFTLDDINQMLGNAGYSVRAVNGYVPPQGEDDKKLIQTLNAVTGKDLSVQYQTRQYHIKVRNTAVTSEEKTRMKYLLRRIENDILIDESGDLLSEMLLEAGLNTNTVMEQIHTHIVDKEKVLNRLALHFCNKNRYDYAKCFLMKSYEINRLNTETQELLKSLEGEKTC